MLVLIHYLNYRRHDRRGDDDAGLGDGEERDMSEWDKRLADVIDQKVREIEKLRAENDRLRAVVEKLPKTGGWSSRSSWS